MERKCTAVETLYSDSRSKQETLANEMAQWRARYDDTSKQLKEVSLAFPMMSPC